MAEAAAHAPAWVLIAYLIAGICFILALRGLSSPSTSQRGNRAGMIGMAIAVATTLAIHEIGSILEIAGAMAIGGAVGLVTARRIQMTAMPQLVAAFHSLVGMAAVLVGAAAFLNPEAFGIVGPDGILTVSAVELGLGVAIGAITFSGSVIAFLKLNGNMSGTPILLPGRHVINLATLAAIVGLDRLFHRRPESVGVLHRHGPRLRHRLPADHPDRRRRHAGRDFDAQQLFGLGGGGDGLHAPQQRDDHHRRAGRKLGRDPVSYIMCRAMNRSFISVIAGGFGAVAGGGEAAAIDRAFKRGSAEDAAFLMAQADQVVIVPGYGMAVSQAQHALREMGDQLESQGRARQICDPPGRRADAGAHERAARRGQRAL